MDALYINMEYKYLYSHQKSFSTYFCPRILMPIGYPLPLSKLNLKPVGKNGDWHSSQVILPNIEQARPEGRYPTQQILLSSFSDKLRHKRLNSLPEVTQLNKEAEIQTFHSEACSPL